MPRIARVVIPGCPHHIIQRGNRRQRVFFSEADRWMYLKLLRRHGERAGMTFMAYCLMENHVHLISIPKTQKSFVQGLAEAHRKFTTIINIREDWRGYLWQGRFLSYPLDEAHCLAAIRYIERNPVRAGLVADAEDYPWSSARAHVQHVDDPLLSEATGFLKIKNWKEFLRQTEDDKTIEMIRSHEKTGRPLGEDVFLDKLEKMTGKRLRAGPARRNEGIPYCVPVAEK
jgi:putative transposase